MKLGPLVSAVAALLVAVALPQASHAAVEDLPGMDTAANMKEWLKLTDAQVAQLKPVIARRLQRVDAAITKVETSQDPDMMALIEELGSARKEFDEGVQRALTPDQAKQWATFKAEFEKDLAQAAAKRQVAALAPVMKLTDDQAKRLVPPFATATQKKLEVFKQLSDGTRISLRDKIKAKRALGDISSELDTAMAAICSPNQIQAYKAATQKKG